MKIAIDIRSAGGEKAGKGWYTFCLVENLLKIDKENEYILFSTAKIPGFDKFKNVENRVITSKSFLWHLKVIKEIKKENIDVFFAPSSYIIPSFLSKKIKSIVTVHDLIALLFPDTHNKKAVYLEKFLLKRASHKASKILAVSENTKNDLIEKYPFTANKTEVIYCAGNENYQQKREKNIDEFITKTNLPKKFFLSVGTILPRKNHLNIIEAFNKFQQKNPDYHLIIVGQKGWQYEEVFEKVKSLYLRKKVHFLDYLSQKSIQNLYHLAEALVFPSLYEGFGIPPLEAMQSGCPVITSNISSLPEVVGNSAELINPNSPEEIAQAMGKITSNKAYREKLVTKGLNQSKKFSWKKSAERLYQIINKL